MKQKITPPVKYIRQNGRIELSGDSEDIKWIIILNEAQILLRRIFFLMLIIKIPEFSVLFFAKWFKV